MIFINFVSITILFNVQLVAQLAHTSEESSAIIELLLRDVLYVGFFFPIGLNGKELTSADV